MSALIKADGDTPVLRKGSGPAELYLKAGTWVAGVNMGAEKLVSIPTYAPGMDLVVWADTLAGTVTALPKSIGSQGTAVRIGGLHYACGSNGSVAMAGGDTNPQINPSSIWDLNFRPAYCDPSAMALVCGMFWADIYLLAQRHDLYGTSAYNVTIACDTARPPRSLRFGGAGSTAPAVLNWFTANEIMRDHKKRLMSADEAVVAFFGATENVSRGNAPVTTGIATTNIGTGARDEQLTSYDGLIQAVGTHWIWLSNLVPGFDNGNYDGATRAAMVTPGFYNNTESRGLSCLEGGVRGLRGVLGGGKFNYNQVALSGSRALDVADSVHEGSLTISARGAADHYCVN